MRGNLTSGRLAAAVPVLSLDPAAQERYVPRVARALRDARLGASWPDSRRMVAHLRCMGPEVHRGTQGPLDLDRRVGLPGFAAWARVVTDASLAAEALGDLGTRPELAARALASDHAIHDRQLAKFDYYKELLAQPVLDLDQMSVALRRIEPEQETAHLHVTLDRVDASGLVVRTAIDLAQTSRGWGRALVRLDEQAETAAHTDELRALVGTCSGLDAELTFLQLAAAEGIAVERVVRGTVGPLALGGIVQPERLPPELHPPLGELVASFSLDQAACDLVADRDNDPILDLLAEDYSASAREGYEQTRTRLGYKVFKDRKFVASAGMRASVQSFCSTAGTRCIVYPTSA